MIGGSGAKKMQICSKYGRSPVNMHLKIMKADEYLNTVAC